MRVRGIDRTRQRNWKYGMVLDGGKEEGGEGGGRLDRGAMYLHVR